jgi:putative transposase
LPELILIERLWEYLKQDLRWQLFQNLDQLWDRLTQLLAALTPELVASITGFPFILDALSVANLS